MTGAENYCYNQFANCADCNLFANIGYRTNLRTFVPICQAVGLKKSGTDFSCCNKCSNSKYSFADLLNLMNHRLDYYPNKYIHNDHFSTGLFLVQHRQSHNNPLMYSDNLKNGYLCPRHSKTWHIKVEVPDRLLGDH